MTNNFKKQVSGQFVHDTIPPSTLTECARCQMLEQEVQRLKWLISNMMQDVEKIEVFNEKQV